MSAPVLAAAVASAHALFARRAWYASANASGTYELAFVTPVPSSTIRAMTQPPASFAAMAALSSACVASSSRSSAAHCSSVTASEDTRVRKEAMTDSSALYASGPYVTSSSMIWSAMGSARTMLLDSHAREHIAQRKGGVLESDH